MEAVTFESSKLSSQRVVDMLSQGTLLKDVPEAAPLSQLFICVSEEAVADL